MVLGSISIDTSTPMLDARRSMFHFAICFGTCSFAASHLYCSLSSRRVVIHNISVIARRPWIKNEGASRSKPSADADADADTFLGIIDVPSEFPFPFPFPLPFPFPFPLVLYAMSYIDQSFFMSLLFVYVCMYLVSRIVRFVNQASLSLSLSRASCRFFSGLSRPLCVVLLPTDPTGRGVSKTAAAVRARRIQ